MNGHVQTLLIEDEQAAINLYTLILEQAEETGNHYYVTPAKTMREAREILSTRPIDLVLLDLKLPNGAGIALIKEVKQLVPSVALVVVTGLSDDQIEREAFESLVDDFILKTREGGPEIIRICRKAVARARARQDLAAATPQDGIGRAEEQLRKWKQDPILPPVESVR